VIILLLIFSLAANGAAVAALGINWFWAQREEPPFTWEGKRADSFLREDLRLKEEKAREVRLLLAHRGPEMRRMRDDIRVHRGHLVDLLAQQEPDRAAIEREVAEIAALQSKMEWEAADRLLALKSRLSADQQERFVEFLRSHACEGMGRGHGRGMGPGGGRRGGPGRGGRP